MSITIDNAEVEALLADLTATTHRAAPDLLLELLRRERERVEDEAERRIAEGLAADEAMRRRLNASPLVDPRPIDEILAYDEHGLPA
ncbi:type II toxin-antitoxin system VapB family antitoxin [Methylobacterium sp. J-072]|uniref:type II toxin-antitoxin system VapB family antitoxin n=1 Tax=Methylobacterium sp. J-072 TaxID=2836651 RepID=UPI001FBBDB8C|nr:type II toxin-antitoxin system VapB family antitoxin [Methylobacterium sp. J-072]MCJ2097141.1 type II toxin-antitoxin system VapB family antitoxin [Methylobacterium sp. J-072]